MWWKKGRKNRDKRELIVLLDKDSCERFDRLKAKLPAFDEDEILVAALKYLEQKVDKIIIKQRAKKNRGLKDTGQQLQNNRTLSRTKASPEKCYISDKMSLKILS